jgi:RHS repeat-associated protein
MNRLSAALTMLLLALLLVGPAAAGDTVYYYSSDTLHSEVVITDASRNVVERTYYAPYGQVLNRVLRDGPGYAGHEEDPESSLVYMQQRYFDPESGRFLSSDPVATTDNGAAFNRYAYANGSPYRYTDPTGAEGVGNEWLAQTLNMGNATDTGPLNRSDMIEAGNFIGGFIPVLSEGLAIKGFADQPSWLSAGIMAASIFDLGGVAKGLGKVIETRGAVTALEDSALVARGGNAANHTASRINAAIGPSRTPGVTGFSAQCNGGTCLSDLGQFIKNKQLGVTTVGEIRAAGGDVIRTPGIGNHVTVTGLSGETASPLFQIVPNPNPLVGP